MTEPVDVDQLRRHLAALKDDGLSFESAHAYQEARQAFADNAEPLLDAYGEMTDLRAENERLSADNWRLTNDRPLRRSYDQLEQRAVGYVARAEEAETTLAAAHDVIREFVASVEAELPNQPYPTQGWLSEELMSLQAALYAVGDENTARVVLDAVAGLDDAEEDAS